METKTTKQNKSGLLKKLAVIGTVALGLGYGYNGETKEITETYQGNFTAEHQNYLVFDKETPANRYKPAKLAIKGPDTLDIGNTYTVNFTEPRWSYLFPKRLNSIKNAN